MPDIRVCLYGAAAAAAGTHETSASAADIGELITQLSDVHGADLERVLRISSFLVDGVSVRDPAVSLDGQTQVDVLPPYAGG